MECNLIKADLHIHSEYSLDSQTTFEQIINRCTELGIDCVALADHGTAKGALEFQKIAPFKVIVAEEILTHHGEIMGLFLKETIPSGISVEEAIRRIHEQGGLVNIPHPFDTFRGSALGNKIFEIIDSLDCVEVFNSRTPLISSSSKARVFAEKNGIAKTAGSDAHTPQEIGHSYVEMPDFNGKDEFLIALRQGKVYGKRSSIFCHFNSTIAKLKGHSK